MHLIHLVLIDRLRPLTHNILLLHNVATVGQHYFALRFDNTDMNAEEERGAGIGGSPLGAVVSHYISRDKYALNMASEREENTGFSRTMALVNVLAVFAALSLVCGPASAEIKSVVLDKQSNRLSVVEGLKEDFVAWANFTDDIEISGWVDCKVVVF